MILGLIARKGGVTKTTLAKTIAAAGVRAGLRVVAVDADGQGNLSSGMKIRPHDAFRSVVLDDAEFADTLVPVSDGFVDGPGELHLLSSFNGQWEVEQSKNTPPIIAERFTELAEWADLVVIDTSPGASRVHLGVYGVADYVLLPTLLERDSILSIRQSLNYLDAAAEQDRAPAVLGIVPNRFAARESVHQVNYGFITGLYHDAGYTVFQAIRNKAVWNQAGQMQTSIQTLAKHGDWSERKEARRALADVRPVLDAVLALAAPVGASS